MSRVNCTNCGRDGHPKWQCPYPPKESTAALKEVPTSKAGYQATLQVAKASSDEEGLDARAGTQALPVDTNSEAGYANVEHRVAPEVMSVSSPAPATKFDKKAWMREYMREHRKGIRRRSTQ